MPTLAELREEPSWNAQYVPQNLKELADALRRKLNLDIHDVGTIGDERHLKGYHRSRRWILESAHCKDRKYSVTETPGNLEGGDSNWVSGIDIGGSEKLTKAIYARLALARADGKLSYIRQSILEKDPWHVHISIDRAHANGDHALLFRAITGTIPKERHMTTISVTLPILKRGSGGLDVATAQGLLNARGYSTKIDGDFGSHTEQMTRQMQRGYAAESIDGVWGPETWTIALTRKDTR